MLPTLDKKELEAAKKTFQEVPRMLKAFESWFGKYPWYEDGYKLITVLYPGMEHQSSVTYGNYFRNGYRDRDQSHVGLGMKFDFIIVHESAHEWWGNNISMRDAADMWIHEGWTTYLEALYVEARWGKDAAIRYVNGEKPKVKNLDPVITQNPLPGRGQINLDPASTPRITLRYDPFDAGEAEKFDHPEKF